MRGFGMITKQQLIESIDKFTTKQDAAKSLGICKKRYLKLLEENGLQFLYPVDKLALKYSKQWLIDNYINTDKSLGTVEYENGLKPRSLEGLCSKYGLTKRYVDWCNYDKLYDMTDPNVYYMAGLIATDGHIVKGGRVVGLGLSGDSEYKLLVDIKNYFQLNKNVSTRHVKEHSIVISGKDVGAFYKNNFNINDGNKTFTVGIPKYFYNEDCVKAYVRGCFDGDGCISHIHHNATVALLTASKDLVYGLYCIIKQYLDIDLKYFEHKYYEISCANISAYKLLDWMYSIDGLKLERKFQRYLVIKDRYKVKDIV